MPKEFSIKDAFIYALLLHIMFLIFLGTHPQNYLDFSFLHSHKPFIELKAPEKKHLSFRFINVPDSVPVQEPKNKNTDLFSDRTSRVEGDKIPEHQPVQPKSEEPFSKVSLINLM